MRYRPLRLNVKVDRGFSTRVVASAVLGCFRFIGGSGFLLVRVGGYCRELGMFRFLFLCPVWFVSVTGLSLRVRDMQHTPRVFGLGY